MNKAFYLSTIYNNKTTTVGIYSSLDKAKQAANQYLDKMSEDMDPYGGYYEMVVGPDKPLFSFLVKSIPVDSEPIETSWDTEHNIQGFRGTITVEADGWNATISFEPTKNILE